MRRLPLAALVALSSASSLLAQSPPLLVGITRTTPRVQQQDTSTCAITLCIPAAFPPVANPLWGGAAYENSSRGTWISNGLQIAQVDADSGCTYLCRPQAMPDTAAGSEVTGLAYSEFLDRLFVTDMSGTIRWYKISNCQLSLDARCTAPLGRGEILTGCATDDLNGYILYCSVVPGTPGGQVYIAKQTSPCQPFCTLQVRLCNGAPLNLLTGLAFDACRQHLWATDGNRTVGLFVASSGCASTQVKCCSNTAAEPFQGLCLIPSRETSSGQSCTAPSCPACPTLAHVITGQPVLGGPMSLDLINAPALARAVLVLNVGPCTPPGIIIGGLCGPILVPPGAYISPLLPTNGGVGCSGGVNFGLTLPNSTTLCGAVLSTQYVGICPAATTGSFVSNCLSWQIGTP